MIWLSKVGPNRPVGLSPSFTEAAIRIPLSGFPQPASEGTLMVIGRAVAAYNRDGLRTFVAGVMLVEQAFFAPSGVGGRTTPGLGRIGSGALSIPARRARFSARPTDLTCRFRSVLAGIAVMCIAVAFAIGGILWSVPFRPAPICLAGWVGRLQPPQLQSLQYRLFQGCGHSIRP